jgi:ABC-type transporter Mla MlaB component
VLKITITETQTESRWVLQGHLAGPWVCELRKVWKEKHATENEKRCVVDLNDVTFIDKSGERLLRAISKRGADLTAEGMYTKHLLEKLKTRRSTLPRLLLSLCVGLVATAVNFSIFTYVNANLSQQNTHRAVEVQRHFQSCLEHSFNSRTRVANNCRQHSSFLAIFRAAGEWNREEKEG